VVTKTNEMRKTKNHPRRGNDEDINGYPHRRYEIQYGRSGKCCPRQLCVRDVDRCAFETMRLHVPRTGWGGKGLEKLKAALLMEVMGMGNKMRNIA
jgi:hypothetical protein